jgi:hypothetical protein
VFQRDLRPVVPCDHPPTGDRVTEDTGTGRLSTGR